MDYLYENLTDEQFQELCSTLIKRIHPTSQVFPVGQRDGGRDSVYYTSENGHGKFDVYQIKFVRVAKQERDVHKWLLDTLDGEQKQVDILKTKGLQKYFLLTNVSGTAFPDSGSIDKANNLLKEKFKIEGICWWRDDLSRALEAYPEIKWSYPQILSGQDLMLISLLDSANEANKKRRQSIELYLLEQYLHDKDVKFQQVDLESRLFDLFVDVPLRIKHHSKKDEKLQYIRQRFLQQTHGIYHEESTLTLTSAHFCLHKEAQKYSPIMLIEGGPGQGKSTISQYVCQVHRARLLNKTEDISKIPEAVKSAPLKLPFKIDLRDLASWINRKNPYSISEEYFSSRWIGTMEAFLTTHIYAHTSIDTYTTNDLFDTIKEISPLFVFDGFDEVADIKTRATIISLLTQWIEKVRQYNNDFQVIITSRPAAFSSSASFPVEKFPHYELTHLSEEIKHKYIDKWIKSKDLNGKSANDLKNLARQKIKDSHLRDFGKSPMQLTILLSLILTKGQSLPSQRTALYDSYIGLFLDREAEKDEIVRNNRNLIIGVHQYLAWILHSEAELYKNDGRIELKLLKTKVSSYLATEGHKIILVDELFTAMKERVCALVARVQGTFEFEIQPLREYFCAKYLYTTSNSTYNNPSAGSLPDIFEALCKNSYWLNVLRYFCGCVKKSELATLHFKLTELYSDDTLKYTTYPIQLTLQLLGDRVFDDYPRLRSQVVDLAVNSILETSLLSTFDYYGDNQVLRLTADSGGQELERKGFELLARNINSEYSRDYISLIVENRFDTVNIWKHYAKEFSGKELTTWIRYGLTLGIMGKLEKSFIVQNLLSENEELENRFIIVNQNFDILNGDIEIKRKFINYVLNERYYGYYGNLPIEYTEFFRRIESLYRRALIYHSQNDNESLKTIISNRYRSIEKPIELTGQLDEIDVKVVEFNTSTKDLFENNIKFWKENLEPWKTLINIGIDIFGDASILRIIAFQVGFFPKIESAYKKNAPFQDEMHICDVVLLSVKRKNDPKYWRELMEKVADYNIGLLLLFTWASPRIIIQITTEFPHLIDKCDLNKLIRELSLTAEYNSFSKKQTVELEGIVSSEFVSNTIKYLFSFRLNFDKRIEYIVRNLEKEEIFSLDIISATMFHLIKKYISNVKNGQALDEIRSFYSNLDKSEMNFYFELLDDDEESNQMLPFEHALSISANVESYPRTILSFAERSIIDFTFKKALPVGKIAADDNWFNY